MIRVVPISTTESATVYDIEPKAAYELLGKETESYLIDVRTMPEWSFVGLPNLRALGKRVIKLSWRTFPDMAVDQNFISQLTAEIPNRNAHLLFLCRTGGRSHEAALTMKEMGYLYCYNITHGFEGPHDIQGQRGKISGWKADNLPWEQQ